MMRTQKVETTLGDLIVALTDEAAPLARDQRELYGLVSVMLSHLLAGPDEHGSAVGIRRLARAAA